MIKREGTRTPSPSPGKKRKTTAKSDEFSSKPAVSSLGEARALLAEEIVTMGVAAAQANAAALAAKTGLTPAQIKNQLTPGRSNVRKALLEAAKSA